MPSMQNSSVQPSIDHELTTKIIRTKICAAGGTSLLQGIEQIRESWAFNQNHGLARRRMYIGVYIEQAIEAFEAVVDAAEQLLRGPPPYDSNADGRAHQLIELDVLSDRAHRCALDVQWWIERQFREVGTALDTRVEEALIRTDILVAESTLLKNERLTDVGGREGNGKMSPVLREGEGFDDVSERPGQ